MIPGSRRQFLALVGTGVSGLGIPPAPRRSGQFDDGTGEFPEFPSPHLVDLTADDSAFGRPAVPSDGPATIPATDPVVHRVWDPAADETIEAAEHTPDGGQVMVRPYEGDREDVVDMVYRRFPGDHLSYLFDIGSTSTVRAGVREQANDDLGDRYQRSFEERGVVTTVRLDAIDTSSVTVEVPYSLYHHGRRSNIGNRAPVVPTPADNAFDVDRHRPLLEALAATTDKIVEQGEDGLADYRRAAVLAEFVQSIPHVTDWESKRELHYVRTPEEALAELNADCKDASLLLYHVLEQFGYDPALVFLIGDVPSVALKASDVSFSRVLKGSGGTGDDDEKGDTARQVLEYPHHLAVGVPAHQVRPVPDGIDEQATFDRGDEEYVYIESTNRRLPGIYHDSLPRLTSVIYRTRQEFLDGLLPLL